MEGNTSEWEFQFRCYQTCDSFSKDFAHEASLLNYKISELSIFISLCTLITLHID